jgi:hypothetical protein
LVAHGSASNYQGTLLAVMSTQLVTAEAQKTDQYSAMSESKIRVPKYYTFKMCSSQGTSCVFDLKVHIRII